MRTFRFIPKSIELNKEKEEREREKKNENKSIDSIH